MQTLSGEAMGGLGEGKSPELAESSGAN